MARAPRADRRTASPNVHGKRNVDYPAGDKDVPVITEAYTRRKSGEHDTADFLALHPDTTLFPNAKKVKEDGEPGDNHDENIAEVFETLPGAIFRSKRYDPELGIVTTTRQRVENTGAAATLTATAHTRYEATETINVQVKVIEAWSLPGPTITEYGFDERFGIPTIRRKSKVAFATLSLPAIGSTITGDYKVTDRAYVPDNEHMGDKIIDGMDGGAATLSGLARREGMSGTEPMPSTLEILLGSWTYNDACRFQPPFLGVHYLLTHHLPASPILCDYTYTFGKNTVDPIEDVPLWKVTSNESRIGLPIGRNTLHDAYTASETGTCAMTVEDMPASDPVRTAYVTGDEYVFNVTEAPVAGGELGLWERRTFSFIAT